MSMIHVILSATGNPFEEDPPPDFKPNGHIIFNLNNHTAGFIFLTATDMSYIVKLTPRDTWEFDEQANMLSGVLFDTEAIIGINPFPAELPSRLNNIPIGVTVETASTNVWLTTVLLPGGAPP